MMKIGVDIVENKRFKNKLDYNFLSHFLTANELKDYERFDNQQAKINFISGRWAVKEAVFKTLTSASRPSLKQIEIGYDNNRAPIVLTPKLNHIQISISHENNYSVAIALNDEN